MVRSRAQQVFKIQQIVVGLGMLILLVKFAAYYVTHSNIILTDAAEAIVNIVAGSFALYSLYVSSKPSDEDHPYGHGKIEFIASGFEGILIIITAILIIWKAILGFWSPHPIEHLQWGVVLVVVSGAANYLIGMYLIGKAAEHRSITLEADGKHLQSDGYISLAILVGVIVIWVTGIALLDTIFAIIAALVISYTGYQLLRKSLSGIMDETDTEILQTIVTLLNDSRRPAWIDIHNLRVIHYGSTLHIDSHVTLPWYYSLQETHDEIEIIASIINDHQPYPVEVFIHADPCIPSSCCICSVVDCAMRQHPNTRTIKWELENVIKNQKHGAQ